VNNVIINGLIPSFGEDTWAEAKTNKAVALVKMEHDLQQPYIAQYKNLTKKEGCRLLGVSKLPFEPKGARLLEFARFIWKEKGLEFAAEKSIVVEEGDDKIKLKLFFPYDETLVLEDDGYIVDGFFKHDIYCRNPELKGKKIIRKQKNKDGATYTFEV
jgi:hypothetical protein